MGCTLRQIASLYASLLPDAALLTGEQELDGAD